MRYVPRVPNLDAETRRDRYVARDKDAESDRDLSRLVAREFVFVLVCLFLAAVIAIMVAM